MEGILLFGRSTNPTTDVELVPEAKEQSRGDHRKLGKKLARILAVTGEQIVAESKMFLSPSPADIIVKQSRRTRGHKARRLRAINKSL
jgi:hypothetical protein